MCGTTSGQAAAVPDSDHVREGKENHNVTKQEKEYESWLNPRGPGREGRLECSLSSSSDTEFTPHNSGCSEARSL